MRNLYLFLLFLLLSFPLKAQNRNFSNVGTLSILPNTEVSTYFDFVNQKEGNVLNDGDFYFYSNYHNEGLFSFSTNKTTGYVVFEGLNASIQSISGNAPSFFYDALYQKSGGFHLTNETTYAGTVNLYDGVVLMDKQAGGAFIFLKGANHINGSDRSHIDGEVVKEGNEAFTYPIGDGGFYRMAGISAPASQADEYTGEYVLQNSDPLYPHSSRTGVIDRIDDKEHWIINQKTASDKNVLVTLSWDDRTTPNYLLDQNIDRLHVLRWDKNQSLWVDEGGIVDRASKTVTTLTEVEGYGIFTLGTIKHNVIQPGDVVIYNGVTPDGDGMNDYFIIDNINQFPNNHVTIYNRWGRKVYETYSYDSNGNVFNGTAQGNAIVNQGEKLPTGTYYYVVEYLYDRNGENQWVKKVGYLHLENND